MDWAQEGDWYVAGTAAAEPALFLGMNQPLPCHLPIPPPLPAPFHSLHSITPVGGPGPPLYIPGHLQHLAASKP